MTDVSTEVLRFGIVSRTLSCKDPDVIVMWRNQQGNKNALKWHAYRPHVDRCEGVPSWHPPFMEPPSLNPSSWHNPSQDPLFMEPPFMESTFMEPPSWNLLCGTPPQEWTPGPRGQINTFENITFLQRW